MNHNYRELGERFLNELDIVFTRLRKNPQHFGYCIDDLRDAALKHFPYLVIFKIEKNKVYINSVKHMKRNKDY